MSLLVSMDALNKRIKICQEFQARLSPAEVSELIQSYRTNTCPFALRAVRDKLIGFAPVDKLSLLFTHALNSFMHEIDLLLNKDQNIPSGDAVGLESRLNASADDAQINSLNERLKTISGFFYACTFGPHAIPAIREARAVLAKSIFDASLILENKTVSQTQLKSLFSCVDTAQKAALLNQLLDAYPLDADVLAAAVLSVVSKEVTPEERFELIEAIFKSESIDKELAAWTLLELKDELFESFFAEDVLPNLYDEELEIFFHAVLPYFSSDHAEAVKSLVDRVYSPHKRAEFLGETTLRIYNLNEAAVKSFAAELDCDSLPAAFRPLR